jgi:16S rRNA (uracil1498-N3)-methyltransferase
MATRFFIDASLIDDPIFDNQNLIELGGDQAHHAIHVMRLRAGDALELFDGQGNLYVASIVELSKRKLRLSIQSSSFEPRRDHQVMIATALPKGDRQKFLVEKLVELGVDCLLPLKAERSVATANANVIERMEKQIIEASKQCGRRYLMQIQPEVNIESLIKSFDSESNRLLADPYANQSLLDLNQSKQSLLHRQTVMAIGPEGGFSDSETSQFVTAAWQPVKLSNHILRIETAAISAAVQLVAIRLS